MKKVVKVTTLTTEEYRVVTSRELRELMKKETKKYSIDEFGIPHLTSLFAVETVGNIVAEKSFSTNPAGFERTYWTVYRLDNDKCFVEMTMVRSDGIFNVIIESVADFDKINTVEDVRKVCPNNICTLNDMLSK